MKAQNDLLSFLDAEGMSAAEALNILMEHTQSAKQNKREVLQGLTQMGAYINASTLTPEDSGMSPGRCPI